MTYTRMTLYHINILDLISVCSVVWSIHLLFQYIISMFYVLTILCCFIFFFFQAEDGIRDLTVTGVQTCALPICPVGPRPPGRRGGWAARGTGHARQES